MGGITLRVGRFGPTRETIYALEGRVLGAVFAVALLAGCASGGGGPEGAPTGSERVGEHVFPAPTGPALAVRVEQTTVIVTYDGMADVQASLERELVRSGRFTTASEGDAQAFLRCTVGELMVHTKDSEPRGWRVKARVELQMVNRAREVVDIASGVVDGVDARPDAAQAAVADRALRLAFGKAIDELPSVPVPGSGR